MNHMTNLRILYAKGANCGIDDAGIRDINLIELNATNNFKITNVNHMTKLQILIAEGYNYGIGDEEIKNLNLNKLYSCYNNKITNAKLKS